MSYNFSPEERAAVQVALIYSLVELEKRLQMYKDRGMPFDHTQTMLESTKSALDKINNSI